MQHDAAQNIANKSVGTAWKALLPGVSLSAQRR
jgi:hypothetical protein